MSNILEIKDLKVYFETQKKSNFEFSKLNFNELIKHKFSDNKAYVKAVDGVSFNVMPGEVLGIVGESGCGKSTLGRAILQLIKPTSGSVIYNPEDETQNSNSELLDYSAQHLIPDLSQDLTKLSSNQMLNFRKDLQIIFQDPLASLNPRMTVGNIIAEPLKTFYPGLSKNETLKKVLKTMDDVGLIPEHLNRYPHEFSGGQCQRIGIARALILRPKVIVCDEPVSALDVSIQAQIINLLKRLQKKYNLSLIFIAHDLSIVKYISDRILVMYLGKVVELSDSDSIYQDPRHPYTKALLSAMPVADPDLMINKKNILLKGELPSPLNPPNGCRFHTRCPVAKPKCANTEPELLNKVATDKEAHLSACYIAD